MAHEQFWKDLNTSKKKWRFPLGYIGGAMVLGGFLMILGAIGSSEYTAVAAVRNSFQFDNWELILWSAAGIGLASFGAWLSTLTIEVYWEHRREDE